MGLWWGQTEVGLGLGLGCVGGALESYIEPS